MRSLLIGLYSGLVLSALRAPLGLELLQLPARAPEAAMAFRAAALLIVAIGLVAGVRSGSERFSPVALTAGAAVGFTLHWMFGGGSSPGAVQGIFSGLLIGTIVVCHRRGPDTRPSKWRVIGAAILALSGWFLLQTGTPAGHALTVFIALLGLAVLVALERLSEVPSPAAGDPPAPGARRGSPGRISGLVLSGAGLAVLGEGVARLLRQLGGGEPADDGVFGSVFLVLAAFGGLAFSRLLPTDRSRGPGRSLLLAASGLGAWGAIRVLSKITTVRGLDRFLRGLGLDGSRHGMLDYDLAVAAPSLVIPAFLIGTVVALCRKPVELAALLVGAAAGTVLVPSLLSYELASGADGALELARSSNSASLAMAGAALAAAGALFALLTARELPWKWRGVGAGIAAAGALFALVLPVPAIQVVGPWLPVPPLPELVLDAPEGLLTVERSPAGGRFATLDRRRLCPPLEEAAPDRIRLRQAWELLPEARRAAQPAVLLVGQLTLERALTLLDLGAARVDRTGSWHRVMPLVEERLFEGRPGWLAGEVLPPATARRKLSDGEYDLVLVPRVSGERAVTRNLASPAETTVVAWLDAGDGLEDEELPEELLVGVTDLVELELGLARGPGLAEARAGRAFGAPTFLAAGEARPRPPTLERLSLRRPRRAELHRARMARRLAQAELTEGLASALAEHFEAQEISSPWDSRWMAVELEQRAMSLFAEAATGPAPGSLAVEAIEALAVVLREKRRVEEIVEFLEVPAERHFPWPTLELALGQADLEFLDPERAVKRLTRLLASWPGTPSAWAMRAEAEQQSGDEAAAAESLERALELAPGDHVLERRLAIAWIRAGDPRGPAALEEALAEHPADSELLRYREVGPFPAPAAGYHPLGDHRHEE